MLNSSLFFLITSLTYEHLWLQPIAIFIAEWLDVIVVVGIILFLVFHRHTHKALGKMSPRVFFEIVSTGIAVGATLIISQIIKIAVAAPRPFLVFEAMTPLIQHGGYDSFPSGHAAVFSALSMVIFMYHRKLGIILWIPTLLIGIARIMVGIHFPVDIAFGVFLGAFIAWIIVRFSQHFLSQKTL